MDLFFDLLRSLIYGVIEGITEWLPISSTGHMILAEQVLKFSFSAEFMEMFRVVIQLGAILAVVVMYFKKLWPFCVDNGRDSGLAKHIRWPVMRLWFKIIVACLPAAVLGLALDDWIDAHFYNSVVVAVMLIVYGIAFILIERRPRVPTTTKLSRITYRQALIVGAWQVLALIPGTSRSGSTIIGGLLCGMSRACASQFTFFLAIPVMAGASGLKLVKFLAGGGVFTVGEIGALLVGCIVAFVVSILAIRFLMTTSRSTPSRPSAGTASPWASSSWGSGPCRHSCWRNIVNKKLLSPGMGGQQLFCLVRAKPPLSKGGAAKGGGGIPSGFTVAACPGKRAEPSRPRPSLGHPPHRVGRLASDASPSAKGSPYRGAGRAREAGGALELHGCSGCLRERAGRACTPYRVAKLRIFRERHPYGRPGADLALQVNFCVVQQGNVLDDGKP